ncbi:MAG: efflux RND transporter periplasmic adaptor subunit [Planctomycetota bacterium]
MLRLLAILVLAVGAVFAWPRVRAAMQRPPAVEVAVVQRDDVDRVLAVTGRMRPRQRNRLTPIERGRLIELEREEGDPVQVGEVVARLDATRLCADIAEASARALEAEDSLAQAQRDLERARELNAIGATSSEEIERVRLALQVRERGLAAAKRREDSLTARREDLVLRSPLEGVVLERPVDPGQTVGPGDVVYVVATVADPWIEAEVDERFLADLALGQSARVAPAGRAREAQAAELVHIGRNVNRLSGAVLVRFRLAAATSDFAVGQTLDVNVKVDEHASALVVPRAAVADLDGQPWVLVAEATERPGERRAVRVAVDAIDWPAPQIVVRGGLEAGDEVLLEPRPEWDDRVVRPATDAGATPERAQ